MPDYCAAVCVNGTTPWRLTEDKAEALAMDDKGLAIFVTTIEDLRYELEKRNPAPEHCVRVFPTDKPGFDDVSGALGNSALAVNSIPYASNTLELESALKVVRDTPSGVFIHYTTLGLKHRYNYDGLRVLRTHSDFVIAHAAYLRNAGWYHIIYDPKKARRILGAAVGAMRRRLSQGIWPFDTEMAFFLAWRTWLLEQAPAIRVVFDPVYHYRKPRCRRYAHDAFVSLVQLTRQLRLLKKVRKTQFYKKHINLAAQYLPGMLNKKDHHQGIIQVLKRELKSIGRVVPKDIPEKEL